MMMNYIWNINNKYMCHHRSFPSCSWSGASWHLKTLQY